MSIKSKDETIQFSLNEIRRVEYDLRFASGVLELFHGVNDDAICNGDIVLMEAENRLYKIREILEEKLSSLKDHRPEVAA